MKKSILITFICTVFMISSTVPTFADYKTDIEAFEYNGYSIPAYDGDSYETVNSNNPKFNDEEIQSDVFESYGNLDSMGRCTACEAHLDASLMPDYERGSIYEVKPTGYHSVTYSNITGLYLYNRCHLIGFQLTGIDCEHKSEYAAKNLITGTRQMNVGSGNSGMLGFENTVADYIHDGGEVLYRVTPVFIGDELVARGVIMEGLSVEDGAATSDIKFCVFCYNVQPGISIDYSNGESKQTESEPPVIKKPSIVKISSVKTNNTCYITKTGKKYHVTKTCVRRPIKTTITKAKKKKYGACKKCGSKRWITVKYKKASNAKGYQISYKKSSASKYTTTSTTSLSRKITGLKKNTTYYVKVRAYNLSGTTRVYGSYSAVKKIKTK